MSKIDIIKEVYNNILGNILVTKKFPANSLQINAHCIRLEINAYDGDEIQIERTLLNKKNIFSSTLEKDRLSIDINGNDIKWDKRVIISVPRNVFVGLSAKNADITIKNGEMVITGDITYGDIEIIDLFGDNLKIISDRSIISIIPQNKKIAISDKAGSITIMTGKIDILDVEARGCSGIFLTNVEIACASFCARDQADITIVNEIFDIESSIVQEFDEGKIQFINKKSWPTYKRIE